MPKTNERFRSANGRRLVLIADDETVYREQLGNLLKEDYEIIYACDGEETLRQIEQSKELLALVLLDLHMPRLGGFEVLSRMKEDNDARHIPVIILTSDQDMEVESLRIGASDFMPKPYPRADVVRARVLHTIELSEDRQLIDRTERDHLTKLYNKDFFYRYADQYDLFHQDTPTDSIVIDINHFRVLNERFGTAYGDKVLVRIANLLREKVSDGILCRRNADTFLIYRPHREDYRELLDYISDGLAESELELSNIHLRMGVYQNVDKKVAVERRFDRAALASNAIRGSYAKNIEIYDETLSEKELFNERLVDGFDAAIREKQFKVFYQPKFDVRFDPPILSSAEALVRWQHPQLGLIPPGVFVPLFEDNGLIHTLDNYVWRTAAKQIRDWKDRLGFSVPVSVNVSRIDLYDPGLKDELLSILSENGLDNSDLLLEITETAYTLDSDKIIDTVIELRGCGFRIEMDDFGSGYSSLNMLSTMPVDALKLDMQLIRNAFLSNKDTRMLEVIIEIADYLSVPVIAEGVETEEQYLALKAIGCDLIQGYFFSKPVPAAEYETFVVDRMENDARTRGGSGIPHSRQSKSEALDRLSHVMMSGFDILYYVNLENERYVILSAAGKFSELDIDRCGCCFFADAANNIRMTTHPDDVERVCAGMRKEVIEEALSKSADYFLTYRVLFGDEMFYYTTRIIKPDSYDKEHIIVGIYNVDRQIRQVIPHD